MKVTKKLAAISAAAVLAGAGAAHAQTYEINMYGSSAQYNFWVSGAASYLQNSAGCPAANITTKKDAGGSTYVGVTGTACTAVPGGTGSDTLIIRYASKASYAGFAAMNGCEDTSDINPASSIFTGGVSPNMPTGATLTQDCQAAANGSNAANFRWFLDETAAGSTAICLPVNVASSDVAITDFLESTNNSYQNGPASVSNLTTRATGTNYGFSSASCMGAPAGSLSSSPITIPFGLFVNSCVANNRCLGAVNGAGIVDPTKYGQLCATDTDCTGATVTTVTPGTCSWHDHIATTTGAVSTVIPNTITDLSREMAACVFTGTCKNWDDFGPYFADEAIVNCLRFAGSGTVASMDWEIIRPTALGASLLALPSAQKLASGTCNVDYGTYPYAPYGTTAGALTGGYQTLASGLETGTSNLQNCNVIWFNDSTGNEISCVAGQSIAAASFTPALTTWTNLGAHTTSCIGAVGIFDSDKIESSSTPSNIFAVRYNGAGFVSGVTTSGVPFGTSTNPAPTIREQIKHGRYGYVADEIMYYVPSGSGITNPYTSVNTTGAQLAAILVSGTNSLDKFAASPSNINNFLPTHKNYYAARSELLFTKAGAKSGSVPTFTNPPTVANP
ncbi:MAG: hypothetical protein ABSA86_11205 [Oryzomonas sp.]|jgi:hypothetical protein